MFSAKRFNLASVATLAALSWTTSVNAADETSASATSSPVAVAAIATPSTVSPVSAPVTSEAAITRRSPFGSKPVSTTMLATKRGGDGVFNDAQLKGVVSDNQASNVTTGMNVISDGALAGSAGLSTVIQNSGNNVLIQSATIVNVQLK